MNAIRGANTLAAAGRRKPRRPGRAASDRERRELAKSSGRSRSRSRPSPAAEHVTVYVDGGARAAPRMAAIAHLIVDADGATLAADASRIGPASAVVAEYTALRDGLRHARRLGLGRIEARSDCRLLVTHLLGEHTPVNPTLVELGAEIVQEIRQFETAIVTWIPSADNDRAHALVSDALAPRSRGRGSSA
jgi:ribonuclease HI